jgi:hypothetical protein
MKSTLAIIFILVITAIAFAGEDLIERFTARSDGSVITVEWKTTSEDNLKKFEIERSSTKGIFQKIATFDAKGTPTSYKYSDTDALLKTIGSDNSNLSKSLFYYRIKLINKDNSSSYCNTITVTHDVSSIKRTWGMIKEMFR